MASFQERPEIAQISASSFGRALADGGFANLGSGGVRETEHGSVEVLIELRFFSQQGDAAAFLLNGGNQVKTSLPAKYGAGDFPIDLSVECERSRVKGENGSVPLEDELLHFRGLATGKEAAKLSVNGVVVGCPG